MMTADEIETALDVLKKYQLTDETVLCVRKRGTSIFMIATGDVFLEEGAKIIYKQSFNDLKTKLNVKIKRG